MTYCTIQDVKTHRGITTTNSDAVLQQLVDGVSAAIDSYCSRDFLPHDGKVETRNGHGGAKLVPYEAPIRAVASVTVDNQSIPAALNASDRGFVVDRENNQIMLRGYIFCYGFQNVVITYDGGYASVPADVKQAAIDWVLYKFDKKDRPDKTMESLAGQNTSFDSKGAPESVKCALNKYRRWMV